ERFDAQRLQVRRRFVELGLLACRDRHARAHLAQPLRDLQPQSARSAGNECDAPGEIEELLEAHCSAFTPATWMTFAHLAISSASAAVNAGAVPLKGIWTMSTPAVCLKSSMVRCVAEPTPLEPNEIFPGLALA